MKNEKLKVKDLVTIGIFDLYLFYCNVRRRNDGHDPYFIFNLSDHSRHR